MTPEPLNPALLFQARDAAVAEVYANSKPSMSDEEWRRFLPVLLLGLNSHGRQIMLRFDLTERGLAGDGEPKHQQRDNPSDS